MPTEPGFEQMGVVGPDKKKEDGKPSSFLKRE